MANLPIFIQYGGRWNVDNSFVDYNADDVIVTPNIRFEDFVDVISKQLMIDTSLNVIEIKYTIQNGSPPIVIHNNMGSILSLAYAIVDSENNASWEWFFARFKDAFREREVMCIVSDMHEGIENATVTLYPQVPHCVCIWNLWNNVKKKYKKNHLQLKDIFFAMAKAYTIEKFNYHMVEVERIDKRVKDYLINVGYERWSRAHSTVNRTLTMTSNITESINAVLKAARELPVTPSTSYLYSVLDKGKQRMVFLKDRTCSCGRFQVDELPCAHTWVVLKYKYIDHIEYCSVYYTRKYLLKTYEISIYLVPDESTWKIHAEVLDENILPPDVTKSIGRPGKGVQANI
ncbi:uncharacterized protein LOC107804849 [Nicotiana tabacum]|uniref:Uncharacterized protein LOC107804849 n=1 Tax=Nicotiana tabacum TaxID=4097 RepID=A0A1S4B651_TOBAC|nr:PREDICTED: uncharacterized protein LOC107804849 [Nicotiana tabacum]